jgi:hypothetical protein
MSVSRTVRTCKWDLIGYVYVEALQYSRTTRPPKRLSNLLMIMVIMPVLECILTPYGQLRKHDPEMGLALYVSLNLFGLPCLDHVEDLQGILFL